MPVFQRLVDFQKEFNQLREEPIIINDLVNSSEEDKEMIRETITTRYSSDMITLLPSCRCGETKGVFSIDIRCGNCGTVVKSSLEDDMESSVWFRKPDGVSKLINPHVWTMLKNRFKKSHYSVIQWICDTTYRTNVKQPIVVTKLIESGVQRGYNNFVENFDWYMEFLFSQKAFKLDKGNVDYLEKLISRDRDIIFSDYVPLPNKSILIIEKTNVGIYVDPIIVQAVDAIEMLVSIDKNFHNQNPKVKENRTIKAIVKLSDFYENYFKIHLSRKTGQYRRHVFGSRTNFSGRAVISSLTDDHEYDAIHVPWGFMTAFRVQILNKLGRLGYDYNSAVGLFLGHVEKYHKVLDDILKEIIAETRYGRGIPCILQRN